jgi:hypothetical protein
MICALCFCFSLRTTEGNKKKEEDDDSKRVGLIFNVEKAPGGGGIDKQPLK